MFKRSGKVQEIDPNAWYRNLNAVLYSYPISATMGRAPSHKRISIGCVKKILNNLNMLHCGMKNGGQNDDMGY